VKLRFERQAAAFRLSLLRAACVQLRFERQAAACRLNYPQAAGGAASVLVDKEEFYRQNGRLDLVLSV